MGTVIADTVIAEFKIELVTFTVKGDEAVIFTTPAVTLTVRGAVWEMLTVPVTETVILVAD